MDPCPFVRIVIGNLALRSTTASAAKFPWSNLCYCKIKLKGFSTQYSTIPWILQASDSIENKIYAGFSFKKLEFDKLVEKSSSTRGGLKIEIFTGQRGGNGSGCGWKSGKLLGSALLQLDLKAVENSIGSNNKGCVIHNGWVSMVGGSQKGSELHVNVKAEPDPRFVFEFDGEPECSPQVFQVNGNVKQSVFSCKFGFRTCGDRNLRTRSSFSEPNTKAGGCFSGSFTTDKEQPIKERKGWSITIHDLSGSPVAAASIVTPFVASPGTDRVSKSNPGAWLILRPGQGTWKPWGRLEAWRDGDNLGYRFELIPDGSIDTITLANSNISTKKGGKFSIDIATGVTPITSPNSSFDFSYASSLGSGSGSGSEPGSGSWAQLLYRGFVMSSTLDGDGKCSKPEVEIGVQHVSCTEDAAAFVALAAALDLSMDACRSFSQKLRKELRQYDEE